MYPVLSRYRSRSPHVAVTAILAQGGQRPYKFHRNARRAGG